MKKLIFLFLWISFVNHLMSQPTEDEEIEISINGQIMKALVTEEGDTLIIADLENVSVTTKRNFKDKDEELYYRKVRRYATKVYPYAAEAIRLYREVQEETEEMKKGKRKRYVKDKQKELKDQFAVPLKNLTKMQGKILIEMIERELNMPFYDVLKEIKGSSTAFYWHNFGKMYGYNLKEPYDPLADPILEMVLQDLNISYDK